MRFEIGKCYRHTTGRTLRIVGSAFTLMHGPCLVGEDEHGQLIPVGPDETNAVNYTEISLESWAESMTPDEVKLDPSDARHGGER